MKPLIILFVIFSVSKLHGQDQSKTENSRQEIWNTIVQSIIHFDQDEIFNSTRFPLEGDWYMQEGQTPDKLKALYRSNLDYFYSQEMRDEWKKKDYTALIIHPYKSVVAYALTYVDELLETTTIVDFAEVGGEWKIVAVTIK